MDPKEGQKFTIIRGKRVFSAPPPGCQEAPYEAF